MRKIGIVGGAGPSAGSTLFNLIIRHCQNAYQCKNDADFPEIIMVSYPFSKMMECEDAEHNKDKITRELQTAVDTLSQAGADIVAIACNTLHSFLDPIDWNGMIPINIIDVAIEHAIAYKPKEILILGTRTTVKSRLFEKGIPCSYPPEQIQMEIDCVIERVLSGEILRQDAEYIHKYARRVHPERMAILACSELSVLHDSHLILTALNPLRALAQRCCEEAYEKTAPAL